MSNIKISIPPKAKLLGTTLGFKSYDCKIAGKRHKEFCPLFLEYFDYRKHNGNTSSTKGRITSQEFSFMRYN
jgi:hypothetical protein